MAPFKKPFSKKREDKKLSPDLVSLEKFKPSPEIEADREKPKERPEEKILPQEKEKISGAEKDIPSLAQPPAKAQPLAKSTTLQTIENILQEDLEEVYFNLDEAHRRMLKAEGERTAQQIEKILISGKSVALKILELIKRWLRLIPGINKFFIEQEAKIKTDKIIKIKK